MILTIGSVTAGVIIQIGERRKGVGEMERVDRFYEKVVGVSKDKLSIFIAIDKYTADAWRTYIS